VAVPTPELRLPKKATNVQCIYFFGTNNYAWIELNNIKPYYEFKEQLIKSCKTAAFKEAVSQIEDFIEHPEKFTEFDQRNVEEEFDKLKDVIEEAPAAAEGEGLAGEGDGESAAKEGEASASASPEASRKKNSTPKDTPPLDLENVSETLLEKNIKASGMTFGFLGLGIMGGGIVKNLLNSGHKVLVWNRTQAKVRDTSYTGSILRLDVKS
ncbi:Nuclear protein NP60-like protein, partial [Operophtera brumata]